MQTLKINGKQYKVVSIESIGGLANLAAAEPNTAAYVYAEARSRMYLIRQYKDGSYSGAVKL